MLMELGAHISTAGGLAMSLQRGKEMGCEAMQLFATNPRTWRFSERAAEELSAFALKRQSFGINKVFGHSIYLINLATSDQYIRNNSIQSLIMSLELAEKAGFSGVVTHIGSHGGDGFDIGKKRVVTAIKEVLREVKGKVPLLLETDAGSGNHLGNTFEELAEIIEEVDSKLIGVCLDTCHIFAAGYKIDTKEGTQKVISHFNKVIGLDALKVLHLNDSRGGLGSRLDRHEEIGKGKIGLEPFRFLVNLPELKDVAGIVETPDNKHPKESEKFSLDTLKELRSC